MYKEKIVYIGGFELPDKNAAAHRVLSNGKIFRDLGYEVIFIGVDKNLEYSNDILNTKQMVQGFDSWSTPYPQTNKQWIHYLSSIYPFRKVLNEYNDVKMVICYNYQSLAFAKMKRYCRSHNIKILADCTEWYGTEGQNPIFKLIKGFDTLLRMRIIHKNIDGLLVVSSYLENYYARCKYVIKLPPLVDLDEEKWKAKKKTGRGKEIRFVYAGIPGKEKDKLNLIVEALAQLGTSRNYTFKVIGMTEEQYLLDYPEHKKHLHELKNQIQFVGRVDHITALSYIQSSNFSIFFRDINRVTIAGFPTKFVESVSCGTPVITTNSSDLAEYIVDGKNGYFLRPQKENLIEDIKNILMLDRAEIEKFKTRCIDVSSFDYRKYIPQTRDYIDGIVKGR